MAKVPPHVSFLKTLVWEESSLQVFNCQVGRVFVVLKPWSIDFEVGPFCTVAHLEDVQLSWCTAAPRKPVTLLLLPQL